AGEVCDDGNRSDNDLCTNACQVARCGDGILHTGVEQCDDGNQNNNDNCSNTCTSGAAPEGCYFVANRTPVTISCNRWVNWSDARRACRDWGGELASVMDQNDQNLLWAAAQRNDHWIGLKRHRGGWRWESRASNFSYWADNQPDDWRNNEDCGEIWARPNGRWNDVRCDERNRYFCER
ncbi:MAG: C-type lectin domain-containing protein, partial [Myxococcota bacterium]|nr:C-type lectin domain-containing protein [Myxococcota bacterium]